MARGPGCPCGELGGGVDRAAVDCSSPYYRPLVGECNVPGVASLGWRVDAISPMCYLMTYLVTDLTALSAVTR